MNSVVREILRLSASPPNIIYPIPLLPLLVYFQSSCDNVFALIYIIVFSSIFYAGINLWNHVNDVPEDILAGRRNVLTENPKVRKITTILSILLYVVASIMAVLKMKDRIGLLFYAIVAFVTWIYSDRMLLGRLVRRWKDYYVTELLAFILAIPFFTLTLWCMLDVLSIKALVLAIAMTFLMMAGIFPKDLKDATGDELAGLKTMAAVFRPSTLIKLSFLMIWLYYVTIAIASLTGIFSPINSMALLPALMLIKPTIVLHKRSWRIDTKSIIYMRYLVYSSLTSLTLFVISSYISRAL